MTDAKTFAEEAASAAENMDKRLTDLIEQTKTDAGAPFEAEAIQMLWQLKISNPAEFERVRKKLQGVGFSRLGELDKTIERFDRDTSSQEGFQQGHGLQIPDLEPWHQPVDGSQVLSELVKAIRRYVVMSDASALAVALWVMFTHVFEEFIIAPILAIQSPEKGCGKSTLLDVIETVTARSLLAANITAAAVFRTIEAVKPTLLIDEADTFIQDRDELRGILNSGHRKGGAVIRTVGEDHIPQHFSTWCPKAIASIKTLPDTLQDRSIVITLKRRCADETVEPFRSDRTEELAELARKVARWAQDNRDKLMGHEPEMPAGLLNRAADNWRPLLAIADIIDELWPELACDAACSLSAIGAQEQESIGTQLLTDIKDIFDGSKKNTLRSSDIVHLLAEMEGRPWAEWRHGKPILANTLARLLKPFGIKPSTKRFGFNDTAKGYDRVQFEEAWGRYLAPPEEASATVTTSQPTENKASKGKTNRHNVSDVTVEESLETLENPDL